jgi:hypothetical protein
MQSINTSHAAVSSRSVRSSFWPRELVLGLFAFLVGFQILVWFIYVPIGMSGLSDFRTLYASGYMARTGQGAEIYSDKILEVKERLAPIGHPFLQAMDHPAYEALFFAPLSLLSYRSAFVLFILINVCIAAFCVILLTPNFAVLHDRWKFFPAFLFAAFFPITRAIVQGQDSLILLALLSGAWICIQKDHEREAGFLTGLGMFKMQIVIPIAIIFLLWRRWRFVLGFACSSGAAALASIAVVGIHGTREYISMLLGMSLELKTNADAMRYSLSPLTMLNLRGIISAIGEGRIPHWWIQGIIIGSSVAVFALVARRRASLPLAIVAAALVSYHLNAQDASILIIPIGLALCTDDVWMAVAGAATLVAPNAAIYPLFAFIGGIPIVALFARMCASGKWNNLEMTDCT